MEGLMQMRQEIVRAAESLKRTVERWRKGREGRPTREGGGSEPRWKKVLLRCCIGVNLLLLVAWVTVTLKPEWLSQVKGRFSSSPPAAEVHKASPVTPAPRLAPAHPTAATQAPQPRIAKPAAPPAPEATVPQPALPQKVERPPTITHPSPASESQALDEYLEIGALYAEKGKYDKAQELFQGVIKQDPSSVQAHINLGFISLRQGKYELAEKEFKEALQLDPASALPYYNLACLYSLKGMEVEALVHLKRALQRDARVKVWALTDADLEALRSDVVFQELLGIAPPAGE